MADPASQIVTRLFERASCDPEAEFVAAAFGAAYERGDWNASDLERILDEITRARTRGGGDEEHGES